MAEKIDWYYIKVEDLSSHQIGSLWSATALVWERSKTRTTYTCPTKMTEEWGKTKEQAYANAEAKVSDYYQ